LKYDLYVDAGCASDDAMGGLYMGMNWAVLSIQLPNFKCYSPLYAVSLAAG